MTSPDLLRPPFIRHIRVSAFNVSFVRSMLFMSVQCYFYVRTVIFMYFQCNLNASKSSWSCEIIFKGKILQQMLPNLMWITTQSCWLSNSISKLSDNIPCWRYSCIHLIYKFIILNDNSASNQNAIKEKCWIKWSNP